MIVLMLACSPEVQGTEWVGPDGGVVEADGARLEIPPGMLAESTAITLTDLGIDPEAPYEGLSHVYAIGPAGLVFQGRPTISLPAEAALTARPYASVNGGDFRVPNVYQVEDDGRVRFEIGGAGRAFVSHVPAVSFDTVYDQAPSDVLIVADNSASMQVFQPRLSELAQVPDLFSSYGLDYHLGLISTDMADPVHGQGKLRTIAGHSYIDAAVPDAELVFALMADLRYDGPPPQGRAAAYTMVELKQEIPRNEGFIRAGATLDVVVISDKQDRSADAPISQDEFAVWSEGLRPLAGQVRHHAVVLTDSDTTCTNGAFVGASYIEQAAATGGQVVDLCTGDWLSLFEAIASDREAWRVVALPEPVLELVEVVVDEQVVDPSAYVLEDGLLRFVQGFEPALGASISISYRPAE